MVGQTVRRGEHCALRAQAVEEAFGAGDGGQRIERRCGEADKRSQRTAIERSHAVAGVLENVAVRPALPCPAAYHRIHTLQAGGSFAQGACGHEKAVAKAKIGGDNRDFRIAGERVVLQAVVGENEAGGGVIAQQLRRRLRAFAGDHHRRAGALPEEQRLIADDGGIGAGGNVGRRNCPAPIAAADDADGNALLLQGAGERLHQRRFAVAADADVADDKHGNRRAIAAQYAAAVQRATAGGNQGKERRQRQQQVAGEGAASPEVRKVVRHNDEKAGDARGIARCYLALALFSKSTKQLARPSLKDLGLCVSWSSSSRSLISHWFSVQANL